MGRPRQHDDRTREALLAAAESLVEEGGPAALSVRAVADAIGTSTRAVYSTFGSKDGLLNALAQRSFELLRDNIARQPVTDEPTADLINAAVDVFRPMAIEHPSMFSLAFLRAAPALEFDEQVHRASAAGLQLLQDRIHRLAEADLLGGRDERVVLAQFNALCQGMASVELRNPALVGPDPRTAWREAFETLFNGLRVPAKPTDATHRKKDRRPQSRR
jgi:AcrR family transcriptional regulator